MLKKVTNTDLAGRGETSKIHVIALVRAAPQERRLSPPEHGLHY